MNKDSDTCDCTRWKVTLPERHVDFDSVCSCAERSECRRRSRVGTTLALLAVFVAAGAVFGAAGARREDSKNLAALREVHLHRIETGGGR